MMTTAIVTEIVRTVALRSDEGSAWNRSISRLRNRGLGSRIVGRIVQAPAGRGLPQGAGQVSSTLDVAPVVPERVDEGGSDDDAVCTCPRDGGDMLRRADTEPDGHGDRRSRPDIGDEIADLGASAERAPVRPMSDAVEKSAAPRRDARPPLGGVVGATR